VDRTLVNKSNRVPLCHLRGSSAFAEPSVMSAQAATTTGGLWLRWGRLRRAGDGSQIGRAATAASVGGPSRSDVTSRRSPRPPPVERCFAPTFWLGIVTRKWVNSPEQRPWPAEPGATVIHNETALLGIHDATGSIGPRGLVQGTW